MKRKKLGILSSHPIQYLSPLFRYLASLEDLDLTVYYVLKPSDAEQGIGFGIAFQWDVDLTSGYRIVWLGNRAQRPSLSGFWGCDTPEIVEIIRGGNFDAFLVMGWDKKSFWQAMQACWSGHTPVFIRGDTHLHRQVSVFKKGLKKLVYPYFLGKFSGCLAVGKWSEEYFIHYGAKKVIRCSHFVDNEWFAGESGKYRAQRDRIREGWNIPPQSVVFLFAGKFEKKKRPMDILRALETLQRDVPKTSAYVLMVGDGKFRASCEDFARSRGLAVSFTGFLNQTQMPKAYATSDIVVLPSDGRETWGLVVNEAMACGLPAIVSDEVGCGPELIEEGKTGFIFACGSVPSLVEKMRETLKPAAAAEMGANARRRVGAYTAARAAAGVLEALNIQEWKP